ncbi:MAG: DNA helicase RecQ [Planctomycetota bacterium]|jgi:ATP-dependent DNA helicase RecQ
MLSEALKKHWGYDSFRPLQAEAMQCVLDGRDSLVVLPTGGGKSLCYQVPAICRDGLAVVVSPLISLMKDQVDGLVACGIPAACINSSLTPDERRWVANDVRGGKTRLLYIAPERLVQPRTIDFLRDASVSFIAVDEAHCISEWGHDFRPEYRELRRLRDELPQVGIHAFTATATEAVRGDIATQLGLRDAEVLVGSFDRPNLLYRCERANSKIDQVRELIERHPNESGIVYCLSRKDVEEISAQLNAHGLKTAPYHAGMDDLARRRNQDAFIQEDVDTIVATVAFGMGIDKSNVRYVIHTGMPKSLENYQQESGRAGRDGLTAECVLLYSMRDFGWWKRTIEEASGANQQAAMLSLEAMANYCTGVRCRHRSLVEYFGQEFEPTTCNACDVCLGDLDLVEDPLIIGQKILSSVIRQGENFGIEYTAQVLKGSKDQRIRQKGHDRLSTWGILREEPLQGLRDWIEQLISQDFLERVGEYNVLVVTSNGRELLRGNVTPRLLRSVDAKKRQKRASEKLAADWEGVDRDLFDDLRILRHDLAAEAGVPAYVVFPDSTLRGLAKFRPSSPEAMLRIKGIGEKKLSDYGDAFLECIQEYCHENEKPLDCFD